MVTPDAKRKAVAHACTVHAVSQRRACLALTIDRSTVRYTSTRPDDALLREAMKVVAAERRRVGYRRVHIMLDRQGIHVVCCILSVFDDMRRANRTRFGRYFEIFMDATLEAVTARDVKGLYAAARRGEARNVVGVDLPFERPTLSDLVIDTSAAQAPDVPALAAQALRAAGALQ